MDAPLLFGYSDALAAVHRAGATRRVRPGDAPVA